MDPEGTDALYNHGIRCCLSYLDEKLNRIYAEQWSIDQIISAIVDKYLILEPESNEEFAFNAGVNDSIDELRRLKLL